jgi:hydroxyacylglutathione hydrolase
MFQRFSDDGLAQSSYLVACDRTREAAIVDPRRDIDAFVAFADRHRLTIAYAIETHTHADFVSGARQLAAIGARVIAGPGADLQYDFQQAAGGDRLRLGDVACDLLHTPGHTPEHISVLVAEPGSPMRVLTGDTLFVGAVGRPDLAGTERTDALAAALYESLFSTLLRLDDAVEVHPGHGAGSLCGSGIGKQPHSTIGSERHDNPFLRHTSREAFVAAVLGDLPETPPYFARMKRLNRAGPPLCGLATGVPSVRALPADDAATVVQDGALLLDLRSPESFAAGHPTGAIHMAFGPRIGYWSGWILPAGARLILLVDGSSHADEARRQLLRVGLDDVAGYVDGGFEAWRDAGGPTSAVELISARELRERLARRGAYRVVDVRTAREWSAGHVADAINIPVGELATRADELRGSATVATMCESGYRSSLAASLLQRAGVEVVNVSDGAAAYRMLEGR